VKREVELLEAFGRVVAERRRELGMSQEGLAERAGLHRTYVGSVERGERNLSFLNLVCISRALRMPLGELLGGVD
jgi:transcriptional regulator with XRE-family HTH domain